MKRNVMALCGLLSAVVLLCSACAMKGAKPPPSQPVTKDALLFAEAERLFDAKSYDAALSAYTSYLAQYPGMPMADAALMKIGMIRSSQGNLPEARKALQRLIADYPRSPYVPDARVALLECLYREGNFAAVTEEATSILKDTFLSRHQILRIYSLLGDSYAATGSIGKAVMAYARAYEKAGPPEQAPIWERFKRVLPELTMADINHLLSTPTEAPFGGFFLYQLGRGLADMEKDRESVRALSDMVKAYPEHPLVPKADALLERLAAKHRYDRFTIGCLLPLTGAFEAYGQRALKGIELAMSGIDESRPDSGLRIVIKDTASDPERSAEAARELCEAQVAAILGPMVTAPAAAKVAQQDGVPIITLTGKEGITELGDYVFRNFMTPEMQVQCLVPYAINRLGLNRFAILYPDEKYGRTMMNLFWDAVIDYGGVVTGAEAYGSDTVDFADAIEKLVGLYYEVPEDVKNALRQAQEQAPETPAGDVTAGELSPPSSEMTEGAPADQGGGSHQVTETPLGDTDTDAPAALGEEEDEEGAYKAEEPKEPEATVDFDAVFIPDAPDKVGLIVPQLAYYDVADVGLLGTNLWHSKTLLEMARRYVQGAVFPDGFFKDSSQPQVKAFVKTFENAYGEPPGFIEAIAFDTARMLLGLVSRPDILFRSILRDKIAAIRDYPGVTGKTSFTPTGDVTKDLFLLKITRDHFRALPAGN